MENTQHLTSKNNYFPLKKNNFYQKIVISKKNIFLEKYFFITEKYGRRDVSSAQ